MVKTELLAEVEGVSGDDIRRTEFLAVELCEQLGIAAKRSPNEDTVTSVAFRVNDGLLSNQTDDIRAKFGNYKLGNSTLGGGNTLWIPVKIRGIIDNKIAAFFILLLSLAALAFSIYFAM